MAINVTLGEAQTQEKPFPKLMKSIKGAIVLFKEHEKGVLVSLEPNSADEKHLYDIIFNYADDWNMIYFIDYNEPITLQNK